IRTRVLAIIWELTSTLPDDLGQSTTEVISVRSMITMTCTRPCLQHHWPHAHADYADAAPPASPRPADAHRTCHHPAPAHRRRRNLEPVRHALMWPGGLAGM